MGKRSDFERVDKDFYRTIDKRAGDILSPFLLQEAEELTGWNGSKVVELRYAEPCYGMGDLANQLNGMRHRCKWASDINPTYNYVYERDALSITSTDIIDCDVIITNPPWSRPILHKMIEHFSSLKPTWLLFDSDWSFTLQSKPYMELCTDIVAVGRLKWIPGTTMSGKDNCSWYRFDENKEGYTRFHGR